MNNIDWLKDNDVDVDKGIELLGDIETYDEIMKDFLEEMKERFPKIEKYKEDKDMDNYAVLVHSLKGDSNYLGFTNLAKLSLEHQLKSQAKDIEYVESHYEELKTEIGRIMKVIKQYLSK